MSDEKLYAGKFKTVEDLEEGYKNSAKVFNQNSELVNTNSELKKKVDELTTIPESYKLPEGLVEFDGVNELKELSKRSGFTQNQFDKLAAEQYANHDSKKKSFEQKKQEIGEEKLQVLKDYIKWNYPEAIQDKMLDHMISDSQIREQALMHRQKLLNSSVPGINKVSASTPISQDDYLKAREDYMKKPHDIGLRDRYVKLLSEYTRNKQ